MADIKNIVFEYLAHRHIDLMPPDVAERYEDYQKNSSFTGHMSTWNTKYYGQPLAVLTTTLTDNDDWEKLYDSCQKSFQKLYENKNHKVGIGSDYNPATKGFIDKWFGTNPNKTFTISKATSETKDTFIALADLLETKSVALKPFITRNVSQVFEDTTYEKFLSDLKAGKYDEDISFRQKVQSVIEYIQYAAPQPGVTEEPDLDKWPRKVGYHINGAGEIEHDHDCLKFIMGNSNVVPPVAPKISLNPNDWYKIPEYDRHVQRFKTDYVKLFDELLSNNTFRSKFLEQAEDPIKSALETAIKDTDYDNKESDDYVPEKLTDSKNWQQRIKKWANDTYENHLRRFTNPSRGTRLYFSPHSQNIMKAFDKAGIKPTDGLEGILAKKDDAKLKNVINEDKNTAKHFDWFVSKMEELKAETPDDFEGALRDGIHLQRLVINLIIKTAKECETDAGAKNKAMTALEVLSVAKYGLSSSRTLNKLNEATKDLSIFSDKDLSWNKNEGIQFITKAADATAKLAIRGVGLAATGIRNFISHRRTKIGNDISKYENLDSAYKKWQKNDTDRHNALVNNNTIRHIDDIISDMNNPGRAIGMTPWGVEYKTTVQINPDNIETVKADLEAAKSAGLAVVAPYGCPVADLENDVFLLEDAVERKGHETNWRDENSDVIHDLVAYWDMLETTSKTHAFTLGSMKLKRDAMLKNFHLTKHTSPAQQQAWDFINNQYGSLRTS